MRAARTLTPTLLACAATLTTAAPAAAQDTLRQELRQSQERLAEIRREREQLRAEMERLQSQVHGVTAELRNIERQVATSAEVLSELDFQAAALARTAHELTRRLILTRDRLSERMAVLRRRLRAIYKRGPLHAVRVLLSAETFGELLNRYKYLRLIASHDRMLVEHVTQLERELLVQERELRESLATLQRLRAEKLTEVAELQYLGTQRERTLSSYQQREQRAQGRLEQLTRDEARLTDLVAELERRRLEAERRRLAAGGASADEGTITTGDLGSLNWPVEGRVVYNYGREQRPNGVVLRWNGIGIGADPGTPVRAVEAGAIVMARPFEGYGPTVMLSHGRGYYTLYLYLGEIRVREGELADAGDVIGTVGGERTPEGPHIEFQVRAPTSGGGTPEPVDPLSWLRGRPGS